MKKGRLSETPLTKREIQRRYYLKNRARILERARQYLKEHPEQRKATVDKYRRGNAAACKQRIKEWKARNKERSLAINRKSYAAHPERSLAATSRWRSEHPERAKKIAREWVAKNKERVREMGRLWRGRNKEHVRELARQWHAANPERAKELKRRWTQNNRGKRVAYTAARRSRKYSATPSWVSKKDIAALYVEAARLGLTVDHIIPLKNPTVCGLHVPWNLQLLTGSDNSSKGNRMAFGD